MTDVPAVLAKVSITWAEIERDAEILSSLLSPKERWDGIVAVARGGLVPAALVANYLGIKNIDLLSVSSYAGQRQHEPRVLRSPSIRNGGEKWVIVDDLVDTGITMKIARNLFPNAHIAVLYAKPAGREFTNTFVREFTQTEWLTFPWEKQD